MSGHKASFNRCQQQTVLNALTFDMHADPVFPLVGAVVGAVVVHQRIRVHVTYSLDAWPLDPSFSVRS